MNETHKKNLKEGREKYLVKKTGLICKIEKDIEIFTDEHQFILRINGNKNTQSYFSSIPEIINELFEQKSKQLMLSAEGEKNLLSVKKAIDDTNCWIREIVSPLLSREIIMNHNDKSIN